MTIRELIAHARQGHSEVLPTLRKVLDLRPELWQNYGNLAKLAQASWLKTIGAADLCLLESMARYTASLRAELAGADASPLEKLQVERIVALNLQVGYYETLLGKYEATNSENIPRYLHERHTAADQQLQQAIVNLARIRRLLPGGQRVKLVDSGEVQATINEGSNDGCKKKEAGPTRI